jgi:hypothetical protein
VQVGRRPYSAESIVLVDGRNAKDRHDGVPDELLDRTTVTLDDFAGASEIASEHVTERLGV